MDPSPVTIIVPAYNEASHIGEVIQSLRKERPHDEILVIDDASQDDTGEKAKAQGARVIRHPNNLGYGGALKTGIRHAKNQTLVFFDADGQHDAREIEILLQGLSHSDMAVGARPKGSGALYRRSGKWFLHRVANYLVGRKIPDLNSGFRAIRRNLALQFIHLLPDSFSLTTTITLALIRSGYLIHYIPISYKKRVGTSTVSIRDFFKTLFLIVRMITLFAPLKIFMPISGLLILIAIPSLIWDLSQKNIGDTTVLLWIMAVVVFLFGLLADTVSLMSRKDFREVSDDFMEEG